jgi:hypothetical protein
MATKILASSSWRSWFGRYADAEMGARNRTEMHEKRIAHHGRVLRNRLLLLVALPFVLFGISPILGDQFDQLELIFSALVAGSLFGAVLLSIVHHLRKMEFHQHCVDMSAEEQ